MIFIILKNCVSVHGDPVVAQTKKLIQSKSASKTMEKYINHVSCAEQTQSQSDVGQSNKLAENLFVHICNVDKGS